MACCFSGVIDMDSRAYRQHIGRARFEGQFTVESLLTGIASGLGSALLDQYDTVTIVSEATPPLTVNLRDATASGPPSPIAQFLKPTVILTGKAGRKVIAPYGESAGSHGGPLLFVLGLVGAGFILGRLT